MPGLHHDQPVLAAGADLARAAAVLVLLHGRGADSGSILSLGQAFGVEDLALLAPQAAGNTWYPYSFLAPWHQNEPYVSFALAKVAAVLDDLRSAGFGPERTMILGFSQGACLAAETVARRPARYGGVFILTGGLIGEQISPRQTYTGSFEGCPILVSSGDPDPHVPYSRVEETARLLADMGAAVDLRRYPGRPHTVGEEELLLVRERIVAVAEADR